MPSKHTTRIEISLVIPAFNEALRLPRFLQTAVPYLEGAFPGRHEILVVDDGSTDHTLPAARRFPVRTLVFQQNRGKGAAVREGMLAAKGELRLYCDADGATPIGEEARLRRAVAAGAEIAIGSRNAGQGTRHWGGEPSGEGVHWHVHPTRHALGRIFATLARASLGLPYADTQCGFKLFTRAAAEAVFSRCVLDRYAFDLEALYIARALGLSVEEVGVSWSDVGRSKVRVVQDGLEMLGSLVKIPRLHAGVKAPPKPLSRTGTEP